ncbi:MAG TPA: DUF983 domain-containing protein [Gemmatimonadaceae bacterium]|nr:DUF983 domain-containing protein [Gemmatimonadaceae bacterium]
MPTNAPSATGRVIRLFGRALLLRCPNCGGGGLVRSPVKMRPDCPTCGLQLDRGESDYFLGAYLFNLVAVELLFAALLGAVVIATWPDVPWELVQWGGVALVAIGAVVCYPFTRLAWLAFDLCFRPVDADELTGPLPDEPRPQWPR